MTLTERTVSIGKKCRRRLNQKFCNAQKFFAFRGKIARENELSFRHGFCLPASCSSEKVSSYMSTYLAQGDFVAGSVRCQTNDPVKYEVLDIIAV